MGDHSQETYWWLCPWNLHMKHRPSWGPLNHCMIADWPMLWIQMAISIQDLRNTAPSKCSWTKWKYFPTISKNMLILNDLFRIIWIEIRPHETWGLIFDPYCWIPGSFFANNWLYFMGWLEFWEYRDYVKFTNCPRTLEGTVFLENTSNSYAQQTFLFAKTTYLNLSLTSMMWPLVRIVSKRRL